MTLQAIDIYPADVKMVYHPYPDSEFSWKLAEALEAAAEQGKFWELHDQYLASVPSDMSQLKVYAQQIGLDMDKFEEALDTGVSRERVELAKQEAVSRGVTQVAIFVNGTEYQFSPGTISDLRSTIDRELERLGN